MLFVLCVGHVSYSYGSNWHKERLRKRRECERDRRASETVEQREERRRMWRERDRTRWETGRLQQLRTNQQERLAAEPDKQRQAQLQRMRAQNNMRKHVCVRRLKKWGFLRLAPLCFAFTSIGRWNISGLLSKPPIRQNQFLIKISGHTVYNGKLMLHTSHI